MAIALGNTGQRLQAAQLMGFSFTVSSGQNLLVVNSNIRSLQSTTSVHYGGQALTFVTANGQTGSYSSMWYLKNPPVGTTTVWVRQSGTGSQHAIASSWSGVDPTTPIEASNSQSANAANASIAVTTVTANAVLVDGAIHENASVGTLGAGQATIFNTDQGVYVTMGSYKGVGGAGTYSMSWTIAADVFSQSVVAIKADASGPAVSPPSAYMTTMTKMWGSF